MNRTIETQRLALRVPVATDLEDVATLWKDPELVKFPRHVPVARAHGQLWPLYQGWCDSLATDRDGVATFTRVTGRAPTVPEADADRRAWVLRTH